MAGGNLKMEASFTGVKNKPFILDPAAQSLSRSALISGFICRAAVIWFAVFGLVLFVADAIALPVGAVFIAMSCAFSVLFFTVMCMGKIYFVSGTLLILISSFVIYKSVEIVPFAKEFWFNIQRISVDKLLSLGYSTFKNYKVSQMPKIYTEAQLTRIAVFILGFIISAVLVISLIRKARILPPLITGLAVCVPVFILNLPESNWGFALIIAGLCGVLVIKKYDRFFRKKNKNTPANKDKLRACAAAGFSGLGATALALLLIAYPAQKIKDTAKSIDFIDEPISYIRSQLNDTLSGTSKSGSLSSVWDSRSTVAQKRKFEDKLLFTLETSNSAPIYLRGWIGIMFQDDKWRTADKSFIGEYKELFGQHFTPEYLTYSFYTYTLPNFETIIMDRSNYGFIPMTVDITGNIYTDQLYVPSFTDSGMINEYNSQAPANFTYNLLFDGIYSVPLKTNRIEYRTNSRIQTMKNPEFINNIENNAKYYLYMKDMIRYYDDMIRLVSKPYLDGMGRNLIDQANAYLKAHNIQYHGPTLLETYIGAEQNRKKISDSFLLLDSYDRYADKIYKSSSESAMIKSLADEIYSGIPKEKLSANPDIKGDFYTDRHETVMAVVEYLSKNMTYTLSPSKKTDPDLSAIENFLFVTKEGYCVQYASSAVLLLRELGIPARYVEGYIADTFTQTKDGSHRYVSEVYDNNGHAWIEVYYDGYGWMQYEATSVYMDGMYGGGTEPDPSETTRPRPSDTEYPDDTEFPDESEDFDPPVFIDDPKAPGTSLLHHIAPAIVIIAAAALFALFIKGRADKAYYAKKKLCADALSGSFTGRGITGAARQISDNIMNLLKADGLEPKTGELQREYAARLGGHYRDILSAPHNSLPAMLSVMSKAEFSTKLDQSELAKIAGYYNSVYNAVWERLNIWKRLRFRYIKRVI